MAKNEIKTVVIATKEIKDALYIVLNEALTHDEIEISYINKFAGTVELLMRFLTRSCGFIEQERYKKDVENTKCIYNETIYDREKGTKHNLCTEPKNRENDAHCSEQIRLTCKLYKPKWKTKLSANCILIEKMGQLKGMN